MSYTDKLQHFRETLEAQHNVRRLRLGRSLKPDTIRIDTGYKFDRVYVITGDGKRLPRYMVESRTYDIFGVKSWTQVNKRRQYGTLDTVDDFDWSGWSLSDFAVPKPGTQAERDFYDREQAIKATHKKRGRRPKALKLVAAGKK